LTGKTGAPYFPVKHVAQRFHNSQPDSVIGNILIPGCMIKEFEYVFQPGRRNAGTTARYRDFPVIDSDVYIVFIDVDDT
jgi:hypothetical protein